MSIELISSILGIVLPVIAGGAWILRRFGLLPQAVDKPFSPWDLLSVCGLGCLGFVMGFIVTVVVSIGAGILIYVEIFKLQAFR